SCLLLTDVAPTASYTLSLHDALPISPSWPPPPSSRCAGPIASRRRSSSTRTGGPARNPTLDLPAVRGRRRSVRPARNRVPRSWRSEEHTSELQSRENLVCRLLLEKKK